MNKFFALTAFLALVFSGCKKDDPNPEPPAPVDAGTGTVKLELINTVGDEALVFGKNYLSPAGDTFQVSKFNYYLSNIVFIRSDGTEYVQPQSYFVMRHPDNRTIMVTDVPNGTYKSMRLLIGVDSTRNTSGAQTGGLDPAINPDMFWSWNSGYIFLKLEGTSPQSGAENGALTFHIGGFSGENKTQRSVGFSLASNPLTVSDGTSTVKINADVNELFTSPHAVGFSTFYYQMQPGEGAKKIADNYSNMLNVESVQN